MSSIDQRTFILGFDLGDGESAVAECQLTGGGEPDVLKLVDNRQSFLTCIGHDRSGSVLLGQSALDCSNASSAYLTFKRRPGDDNSHSRSLAKQFFQEVLRRAESAGCAVSMARIVLGHPSAWTQNDVRDYVEDLRGSTGWQVQGISESRAAFLQLKESRKLTVEQLRSSTLIVDVGSSTTDFTLIQNLKQQPIEFGHNNLGGRLIDRTLLHYVIERHCDKQKMELMLKQFPNIYAQCEHVCRIAKEMYFSDEGKFRSSGDYVPCKQFVEVDDTSMFRVKVSADDFAKILGMPQLDLNGRSWRETFRLTLVDVKRQAEETAGTPQTIALTGGGARMEFTRQLCQEVFPNANLLVDSTPEFTIVKGLARAGKLDVLSAEFFKELDPLCEGLPVAFSQESDTLLNESVSPLAEHFVSHVLRPGLLGWRSGKVRTLNDLEGYLKRQGEEWSRSEAVSQIVERATNAWSQRALLHITPKIQDITFRYGLPYESLNLTMQIALPNKMYFELSNFKNETAEGGGIAAGGIAALIGLKVAALVTPIVLTILVKSTIIAAAVTGPVGWVVGGIIVGGSFLFGKETAEEYVKGAEVPLPARGFLLSDDKIEQTCRKSLDEVSLALGDEMTKATQGELIGNATKMVREELERRMQEAVVLIGR